MREVSNFIVIINININLKGRRPFWVRNYEF